MVEPRSGHVARTVLGEVDVEDLGLVSCHEHVFIDLRPWLDDPDDSTESHAVRLETRGWNTRDPLFRGADNNVLEDPDIATRELVEFVRAGGGAIVDLTSTGLDPQPLLLAEISRQSRVHIVLGCGHYRALSHDEPTRDASASRLTDDLLAEIELGVGGSGVRPGIIGEIGTSDEVAPSERRALIAAARAQVQSGLSINVHTDPWAELGCEVLDELEAAGADLSRVVVSHLDHGRMDPDYLTALAERGAVLEFDGFGCEWYIDSRSGWLPRDTERINTIARLFEQGFGRQVVIGQDVCRKIQLKAFGGWGYSHIPENVLPMMRAAGFLDADISLMTRLTPHRLLGIDLPRSERS